MILMDRALVPDVSGLEVYFFRFHTVFLSQSFERIKLLLMHLAKA